jgi:hypothetical protein
LRTGSGNFSRSGLASQDNDAIFITDSAIVDAFDGNFERLWRAKHRGPGRIALMKRKPLTRLAAPLRQSQWRVAFVTLVKRLRV